jgi:hypothetical protein
MPGIIQSKSTGEVYHGAKLDASEFVASVCDGLMIKGKEIQFEIMRKRDRNAAVEAISVTADLERVKVLCLHYG